MALTQCPNCHATARRAGNQLYCSSCGWNRDGAIAVLRSNLKMMPFGVVVFAGFTAFIVRGWHFRNPIQIAIFCGFPAFAMLLNYIFARRSLATLEALPALAPRPAAAASDGSAFGISGRASSSADDVQPTPEATAKYQALLRTSRPREIRMSSSGKFGIIAGTLFSLGLATAFSFHLYAKWIPHQSFARFNGEDWVVGGIGILLLLFPYGIWRGQKKECDLLENGEVALGKVTRQWMGKDTSSIEGEFKDSSGQVRNFSGFDNSRSLFTGMTVPVFYDRENPTRQVAYCATAHEVVT
jgi:hypothetical protein